MTNASSDSFHIFFLRNFRDDDDERKLGVIPHFFLRNFRDDDDDGNERRKLATGAGNLLRDDADERKVPLQQQQHRQQQR